jgi:hypothetical protein
MAGKSGQNVHASACDYTRSSAIKAEILIPIACARAGIHQPHAGTDLAAQQPEIMTRALSAGFDDLPEEVSRNPAFVPIQGIVLKPYETPAWPGSILLRYMRYKRLAT